MVDTTIAGIAGRSEGGEMGMTLWIGGSTSRVNTFEGRAPTGAIMIGGTVVTDGRDYDKSRKR